MRKNIIFIYPNSFPISGSATNRLISLCKGLLESNNLVEVIINRPTEKKVSNRFNFNNKGTYQGINFEYATKNMIWPASKLLKILWAIKGLVLTLIKVYNKDKTKKIDVIISAATYGMVENCLYLFISRIIKAKFLYTVDEYPWVLINKERYHIIYRWFYLSYFYRIFDGFIVMTTKLMDFYKGKAKEKALFVHIPMSVEMDRFDLSVENDKSNYIAYCGGDFKGTKDGVDILIKSFNDIKNKHPYIFLYIIGNIHSSIIELVKFYNLENRVKFIGYLERDLVPDYLLKAKALCLARPNTLQTQGGFPTKVGEYLATGKPVILTIVGEIEHYLKNGVSAYISEPGDAKAFGKKIDEVLSNYEEAIQVGKKGKIVANYYFNYRSQGKILNSFLNSVIGFSN